MRVCLFSHANRNKTVKTSFGNISFDANGYADATLDAAGLEKAGNLKWLVDGADSKEKRFEVLAREYESVAKDLDERGKQLRALEKEIMDERAAKEAASSPKTTEEKKVDQSTGGKTDQQILAEMEQMEAEQKAAAAREEAAVKAAEATNAAGVPVTPSTAPVPTNAAGAPKSQRK